MPYLLDLQGIERSIVVKVPVVSMGGLVAENGDAIVLELAIPRMLAFDLILGRTFLDNFKLTLNAKEGSCL